MSYLLEYDVAADGRLVRRGQPPILPGGDEGWLPGWGFPAWRDEFDYTDPVTGLPAVDPAKWNVRTRSDIGLLPDLAEPRASQVTVTADRVLRVRAEWLDAPIPHTYPGKPDVVMKTGYLDHRLINPSDVTESRTYGRWEIRCKVPTGPKTYGALAAFWLRQQGRSGELDIMESWGFDTGPINSDQKIGMSRTTALKDTMGGTTYYWWHGQHGGAAPNYLDWHTYAWEYTPTYAAIFMDGVQLVRFTPAERPILWDPEFYGLPQHVRLNLHVGMNATYYGMPDWNDKQKTQTPLDYLVDYVRIWNFEE